MHIVIMKIEKKHKMPRLFVIAALIVAVSAVSGVTVIMTSPTASGLANLAYAAEERGCVVYQTYPAQVSCSLPVGSGTFSMV
jgi:hypothetical protein